jgi:WD40 repeat protein
MEFRSAILILLMLVSPEISRSESHTLTFVKQIGVGWQTDKWAWMSFVAFSQDGTMVASDGAASPGDVSGSLTLWSFPEGRLIKHVPINPTAISGDLKYYATFHGVGEIGTGKPLISLAENVDALYAFSPDSRYVAESRSGRGSKDSHIRVVDLASGKQVIGFGKRDAFALVISADGVTLASGYWNVVTLWNMLTGQRLAVLEGFGRYVEGLSFSKDGKLLAAATDFGEVQIWDVGRRIRLQSVQVDGGHPSAPAFSPDGRLLAVGTYGTGTVWLIDVSAGKLIDHQKVSDLGCGSVAFSPDGRFLITPSTGGLIKWPYDWGGTIRVFRVTYP